MRRGEYTIAGSDHVSIAVTITEDDISFRYRPPGPTENALNIFIALGTHEEIGAAVLPFGQHAEGSTVFLPFKSDLLLTAEIRNGQITSSIRWWERWRWSERETTDSFEVSEQNSEFVFRIPQSLLGDTATIDIVVYAKDPNANDGWGWLWGCADSGVEAGTGDKYIPHYHELNLRGDAPLLTRRSRDESSEARIRIY